jgi:hypothetical protein
MRRVRPVHANYPTRHASDRRQVGNRNPGGVGSQDHVVADLRLEILEDLLLERLLLWHCFHNEARTVECCREIGRGGDARSSSVGVLRRHESAAGQGGVDEVDRASRFLELLGFHIVKCGIKTIAGERRRHAGAHRTGTDDGDFLNRVLGHHVLSFVKRPLSACLSIMFAISAC